MASVHKVFLITGTLLGFLFCFDLLSVEKELNDQSQEQPLITHLNINDQDLEQILAPIREISDTELRKLIMDNKINHPFFKIISTHPKIINFTIKMLKDKKALFSLVTIPKEKKRIIIYLILIILSMLLNYYQKRRINKNFLRFYQRIPLHLFRIILVNLSRIFLFIFLFYQQLKPTIDIIYIL